ncbi:unnamed protein product [Gordionus sp. m RMFG-2023]|uniref:uncharacterized protein LOC135927331 isoform X1 n=1 Tax=Gordionus sp. m RMFG-2023 TaxID=3053472 RepID=UPI0030E5F294
MEIFKLHLNKTVLILDLIILISTFLLPSIKCLLDTNDNFKGPNEKLSITSVSFPPSSSGEDNNSPHPCFLFEGNVQFMVAYTDKMTMKPKLITFELPSDSVLISGNCSTSPSLSPSSPTNFTLPNPNLVSISAVFEARPIRTDVKPFDCVLDLNFSASVISIINNVTSSQMVNPLISATYVTLDNMTLNCDIKEAVSKVYAHLSEPIRLTPLGNSFTCGQNIVNSISNKTVESNDTYKNFRHNDLITISLWPPFITISLKAFRVQAFRSLVDSAEKSEINKIGVNNSKTGDGGNSDDRLDKYFGPAVHCDSDYLPLSLEPNNKKFSKYRVPFIQNHNNSHLGSDVKTLYDYTGKQLLNIDLDYFTRYSNPFPFNSNNTTTSNTTASTATTGLTTTSSIPTITTPTPSVTMLPNTVPAAGQWMIYYDPKETIDNINVKNSNIIDAYKRACLAFESSLAIDVTYLALKGNNKTDNKQVKIAVPTTSNISGKCTNLGYFSDDSHTSPSSTLHEWQNLKLTFPVNNLPWYLDIEFETLHALSTGKTTVLPNHYALRSIRVSYTTHSFNDSVNPAYINLSLRDEALLNILAARFNETYVCTSENKIKFNPNLSLSHSNTKVHPFIPYNYSLPDTYKNQSLNGSVNIEAYFQDVWICYNDRMISDKVAIAVGCALAALICVVLIAYFIARSRRSGSWVGNIFRRGGSENAGTYQPID